MGFTEILTIIFVLLKVFDFIDWSWWLVFLPEIIAGAIYAAVIIKSVWVMHKCRKEHERIMKDMWD